MNWNWTTVPSDVPATRLHPSCWPVQTVRPGGPARLRAPTHLRRGQSQDVPLADQVRPDQRPRVSIPELDLPRRVPADDRVVGEEDEAPDHHLPALPGAHAALHQQPAGGVA